VDAPALKQHVLPALIIAALGGVQIILNTARTVADVVLTFDITGYFLLTCSSVLKPSKVHVERL
jgi:hypothetical protein